MGQEMGGVNEGMERKVSGGKKVEYELLLMKSCVYNSNVAL